MILQLLLDQVYWIYMNKGRSTVKQKWSSLFLYFQLGFDATRLVSSDNWRHKHPFWEPRVALGDAHHPLSAQNADPSPSVPPLGHICSGFCPLQPTKQASHSLWAFFSQDVGNSSPSFKTTIVSNQTEDHWSWGSLEYLQKEGHMLCWGSRPTPCTEWGWYVSTEAWCPP